MKHVVLLGSGSFGTAAAFMLAERGMDVFLWGRNADTIQEINERHTNERYLPGIQLPAAIQGTTSLDACAQADLLVFTVPSRQLRGVCDQVKAAGVRPDAVLLSGAKGIERAGKRMSEVLSECFPGNPVAVLSGPTHAEELVRRMPSTAVIGCADEMVALRLQQVFTLPYFRSYTSTDVLGIEIGGAVKNIAAIAGGIVEGLGLGDNAKAGLVTRGLAEMIRLGVAMGGQPETFMGLSGVGDLMVTCFSDHSRNTRVGRLLGKGMKLSQIQEQMHMVAEGVPNTESVYHFAKAHGIRTPITDLLYEVLQERMQPAEAVQMLLSRSPRSETE